MKKLLFLFAFLSTSAFAIDRPIPCTGNSCKLLFETTSSGGAKVSAGEVSGLGVWKLGPTDVTTSAAVNEIRNGSGANTNGTNTLLIQTGNQGAHAARLKIQNSVGGLSDVFETTVGSGVTTFRNGTPSSLGSVDNTTGSWTLGTTDTKIVLGGYSTASAMIALGGNCTVSPCTITSDRGGMLSSVTRSGTGAYTVNFTGSYWTAGPSCVVSNTSGSSDTSCRLNTSGLSATSYGVSCSTDSSGTATDSRFAIICHGPR